MARSIFYLGLVLSAIGLLFTVYWGIQWWHAEQAHDPAAFGPAAATFYGLGFSVISFMVSGMVLVIFGERS